MIFLEKADELRDLALEVGVGLVSATGVGGLRGRKGEAKGEESSVEGAESERSMSLRTFSGGF
jgi:hypothetical protein